MRLGTAGSSIHSWSPSSFSHMHNMMRFVVLAGTSRSDHTWHVDGRLFRRCRGVVDVIPRKMTSLSRLRTCFPMPQQQQCNKHSMPCHHVRANPGLLRTAVPCRQLTRRSHRSHTGARVSNTCCNAGGSNSGGARGGLRGAKTRASATRSLGRAADASGG